MSGARDTCRYTTRPEVQVEVEAPTHWRVKNIDESWVMSAAWGFQAFVRVIMIHFQVVVSVGMSDVTAKGTII